jgi:secreted trypsin-like serine protease
MKQPTNASLTKSFSRSFSNRDPTVVYPGRHNLDNPWKEKIIVDSYVRHPEYGTGIYSVDYDIMIVHLTESSTTAKPIRLNYNDEYPVTADESLSMLGFGSTIGGPATGLPDPPNQQARILQKAETLYVPFESCAVAKDPDTGVTYGISATQTAVSPHWFCTTGPASNTDLVTSTCYGDSGGPILKEDFFEGDVVVEDGDTNDLLLAVISGTSGFCGNSHLPLWNQRVSFHKDWIVDVGCKLSNDPPAEWNCLEGFGMAPEDNSVYFGATDPPTDSPSDKPTVVTAPAPTTSPTVEPTDKQTVVPTPAPTTVEPTDKPTVVATPVPTTSSTVASTAKPTIAPTPAPTISSTVAPPTAEPTVVPTPAPTISSTVAPPTAEPTVVPTLAVPIGEPTETPITQSSLPPTVIATTSSGPPTSLSPTPAPTPRPTTEKPNPFLAPILNPDAGRPTRKPTEYPTRGDDDDDVVEFVCPICQDEDEIVTNPEAVVFVPVLGQKTCQELFEDAAEGQIGEGSECNSVMLMASAVCSCAAATSSPTVTPSQSPSMLPTNNPTMTPSVAPSDSPTASPTISPTKTPDTCQAIKIANEARDPTMMVNVTINFAFEDAESANSVGWFLSDPGYECFRVGVAPGTYTSLDVTEPLRLVGGVEYLFVLEVDGGQAHGSYNVTSNNATLARNLIDGVFYNEEGTFFMTPRNQ